MTRQRYNVTESLNRILRLFQGKAIPTDVPGVVTGDVLPTEKALSDLTELLGGSLPNETAELPASLVATVDEANADTSTINTRAMTPVSHQWAHEYGGIFVSTGTASSPNQIIVASLWTQITGTFKGAGLDSGAEIVCNPGNDRIVINELGTYFVAYHVDILNRGVASNFEMMVYAGTYQQNQTRSYAELGASGTVDASKSLVAFGNVYATTGTVIALYAYTNVAVTIKVATAQLLVQRNVG